jgi:hypothetical protein
VRPRRRAACRSFPIGNQHSLIQARLVDRMTHSSERIKPSLAPLTVAEELPERLLDQFIGTLIPTAGEFLFNLLAQIRR